jgi:hypothetical protein
MTISRLFGATMVAGAPATGCAAAKGAKAATESDRPNDAGRDPKTDMAPTVKPGYGRAMAA